MDSSEAARVASDARARRASRLHGIYAILNDSHDTVERASAVIGAGVRVLQYRAKKGVVAETIAALVACARRRGALLIVNDDVAAAVDFDCDGVHLGPGDRGFDDVAGVRRVMNDRLIGLSCGTPLEVRAANREDVDYVGAGSVFATRSKDDAGDPIGIGGLERIAAESRFPVAAIGGIDEANVAEVARCGVAMAAVISAIAGAVDTAGAAKRLVRAWKPAQ